MLKYAAARVYRQPFPTTEAFSSFHVFNFTGVRLIWGTVDHGTAELEEPAEPTEPTEPTEPKEMTVLLQLPLVKVIK